MPIHHITKTADSQTETLPDITGAPVKYGGVVNLAVEVIERGTSEPTVSAGSDGSAGSYNGVVKSMRAVILPDKKLDGTVVWETTTTLEPEGESI